MLTIIAAIIGCLVDTESLVADIREVIAGLGEKYEKTRIIYGCDKIICLQGTTAIDTSFLLVGDPDEERAKELAGYLHARLHYNIDILAVKLPLLSFLPSR